MKFTVIDDGYFDGPGSTIEFSIVEHKGSFYLRKVADASQAHFMVAAIADKGAYFTWETQANNFKQVIREYSRPSN